MFAFAQSRPTKTQFLLLFLAAFAVRGVVFESFIRPAQRYHQPDSGDYHVCSVLLAYFKTFVRVDTGEPVFWRTPGYAAYLYPFYKLFPSTDAKFETHAQAHRWAIRFQILISSVIPWLLYLLAFELTGSTLIGWLLALMSVVHLGFVLASTYLLTDALASIFFYLFLICLAKTWLHAGQLQHNTRWYWLMVGAAATLGIYTWMRPNGEFYAIVAALVMLCMPSLSWWDRIKKPLLFILVFFASLSPWYIRNYQHTGHFFFCPMAGVYLNSFCVPKILRRLTTNTFTECANMAHGTVAQLTQQKAQQAKEAGDTRVVSGYLIAKEVAYPIIKGYPLYFLQDWIAEVWKTVFDLFSHQLVAIVQNCYQWDPPEEFLSKKLQTVLLGPIPLWIKLLGWLELLLYIIMWIGVVRGFAQFVYRPLLAWWRHGTPLPASTIVWLVCLVLFWGFVIQTGGFGYARLRIPVEPLVIIASLMWYCPYGSIQFLQSKNHSPRTGNRTHE